MIFVGVDWAEAHHDVFVMSGEGVRLAAGRVPDGVEGVARVHAMVAAHADSPDEVVVGIETDRGLFVQALVAAGYEVYGINPLSASRYRERHSSSGAKSDPGDAKVLADLVRTDRHNHRTVAADSETAEAVKVLARAHQNLVWDRIRQANRLRSVLREFYPAALDAFDDIDGRDALAVLAVAPTPSLGRTLSRSKIAAALRRAGRQRAIEAKAEHIQTALRCEQLTAPVAVAEAMGAQVRSLVAVIAAIAEQTAHLEQELTAGFKAHPDAEVVLSLPGLGTILGARVLGEFGDAPNRYATPKSRKNYAGTSPITRASGTKTTIMARYARNQRLTTACYQWAFSAISVSPGARHLYDTQKARGASHHQALRAVANRLVGLLHGCLTHHQPYNETTAWAHRTQQIPAAA